MDNNENKRFEAYSDPRVTNLNGQPYHSASENDGKPFSERGYESAANQGYGGANYNYGSGYEGQSGYADQNGYAGQNRYAGQNGYTDYNGYAQRGNVPLDKKGRPLQNRYGLKTDIVYYRDRIWHSVSVLRRGNGNASACTCRSCMCVHVQAESGLSDWRLGWFPEKKQDCNDIPLDFFRNRHRFDRFYHCTFGLLPDCEIRLSEINREQHQSSVGSQSWFVVRIRD